MTITSLLDVICHYRLDYILHDTKPGVVYKLNDGDDTSGQHRRRVELFHLVGIGFTRLPLDMIMNSYVAFINSVT